LWSAAENVRTTYGQLSLTPTKNAFNATHRQPEVPALRKHLHMHINSRRLAPSIRRILIASLAVATLGACFTGTLSSGILPVSTDAGADDAAADEAATDASSEPLPSDIAINVDDGEAPQDNRGMNAWLRSGRYKQWPSESVSHASTGPHDRVRSFLSPKLAEAMQRGLPEAGAPTDAGDGGTASDASGRSENFPLGSATVKEFLANDDTITGWAVSVKTRPDNGDGQGWYFWEVFQAKEGAVPIEGQALQLCVSCHRKGRDYVMTPFPLR
jgi:hypothetical protein